jgi:hypothetical protein
MVQINLALDNLSSKEFTILSKQRKTILSRGWF